MDHRRKAAEPIERVRGAFPDQTRGWAPGDAGITYKGIAEDLIRLWPRDVKEMLPRILIEALSEEKPFKGRETDSENLLGLLHMEGSGEGRDGRDTLKQWKEDMFKDYDRNQVCAVHDCFVLFYSMYKETGPFDWFPDDFEAVLHYWGERGH